MILDLENLFSDKQAITATARSTNIIDLGATGTPKLRNATALKRDIGNGRRIPLLVQVVEDFNNLTSLTIDIETDDNSAFSSSKKVMSITVALADLKAGKKIPLPVVPYGVAERYLSLLYTVTGTAPSTGKISAGITAGNDEL